MEQIKYPKGNKNELIIVKGARENNLKSVDVVIPRGKMTVMTGVSGSGVTGVSSTFVDSTVKGGMLKVNTMYESESHKEENPNYEIDVRLCAFTEKEYLSALEVYNNLYEEEHKLKK